MGTKLLVYELEDLQEEPFGFEVENLTPRDWREISSYVELSEEFIRKYHDKLDWDALIESGILNDSLVMDFIQYFKYPFQWERLIISCENLSNEFLIKFRGKFEVEPLFEYQKVSAKLLYYLLRESKDRGYIAKLALEYQTITPQKIKALEKAGESINWYNLSVNSKLSKSTLKTFTSSLHWNIMMREKEFSEEELLEFQNFVDWNNASEYQKMSKDFILEHSDKINIERLRLNKKVDQEELNKHEVYTVLTLLQTA
ncbi:gp380 [Bacillus phage G]|uniref:Gp380 n=1 Tax=Bacillus phage G TaxID=2884420 RepID=G3MAC1_9CAUD|nr:gp380 [Bacillus phage G]AEO93639.1 gp380 [Bacillus phage G]